MYLKDKIVKTIGFYKKNSLLFNSLRFRKNDLDRKF